MHQLFTDEITGETRNITRAAERAANLSTIGALLSGVDLDDVQYVSLWEKELALALREDKSDSKLAHKLAQHLGVSFRKEKNYDGDAINLVAPFGDWTITIRGYVGTCRVIETTETLSDEEYAAELQAARAPVKRTRVVKRIDCGKEPTNEESDTNLISL